MKTLISSLMNGQRNRNLVCALCLLGTALFSCRTNQELSPFERLAGEYELLDMVIINEEGGIPRLSFDIEPDEAHLSLQKDGSFQFVKKEPEESQKGSWAIEGTKLVFSYAKADKVQFHYKITETGLELVQSIPGEAGFASSELNLTWVKE